MHKEDTGFEMRWTRDKPYGKPQKHCRGAVRKGSIWVLNFPWKVRERLQFCLKIKGQLIPWSLEDMGPPEAADVCVCVEYVCMCWICVYVLNMCVCGGVEGIFGWGKLIDADTFYRRTSYLRELFCINHRAEKETESHDVWFWFLTVNYLTLAHWR